jgi:riboflavin kinase
MFIQPISKGEHSLKHSEYLNLPDLQFLQWCQQIYGLNKGVYNTIDRWFYEFGIVLIEHRRIYILAFLDFVKEEGVEQRKYLQFGRGGLTKQLQQFIHSKHLII